MGSSLVQATFSPTNVRLFDMSCTQAIILLAFNNADQLSYQNIAEITGLSDTELKRQLVSLSLSEHQVLIASSGEQSKAAESNQDGAGETL